ncbi:cytoskeletal protein Sojo-like [Bradysia coprophila]|uniref:cytoskeletal protein Sojo-like n=1 Tax=Bradysia coprophila TaxID=38358 RepID=UPI00187DC9FD|nr:cytoskeletal protein Sojo-like [Bradysia coprophila]
MSEFTEPNNDVKSVPENSCQLSIPFPKHAELTVVSQLPVKKSTSIKLNRKAGGIFNNQAKAVRSVSSINQQALKASTRRPKTISTINDKFINDKSLTSKQYPERKLLTNSLSKCNSGLSLCSTPSFLHKPGTIPSYLKGDSKSSIESEFFAKFRKFKSEKKKLHEQQANFKREYNDLKRLKQKLINLGGKELRLDEIHFVDLDGGGSGESKLPLKCEGTAIELAKKDIDISLMNDIEAQIYQMREGDLSLRNKFLKASSDILENLNRIQDEDIKQKCLQTFKYFEDHNDKFKSIETETKELLSQNLIRLKKDFIDAATESSVSKMLNDQRSKILEYQIDNSQLKKQVEDLGKKLKQSEQHVKTQEAVKRDMELNKEMTQKQMEEHLAEIEKMKTKLKTAKLVEEKLKKEADNLRSDVTSYESEIVNVRAEINSCKNQLTISERKCFDLTERLRFYESKCVNLEDRLELASTETMHENQRLCRQIEELQSNLKQRDNKVTSLQHMFKAQDAENVTKEFNDAMDGIKQLRGSSFDSYKLDFLKDPLNYRCLELTNQEETFSSIQKLLVIRDNLLASMRNE